MNNTNTIPSAQRPYWMKKEEKGEQCGREENARLLLKDNAKSEKKNKIQYYFFKIRSCKL